jgi:hypothetical protein
MLLDRAIDHVAPSGRKPKSINDEDLRATHCCVAPAVVRQLVPPTTRRCTSSCAPSRARLPAHSSEPTRCKTFNATKSDGSRCVRAIRCKGARASAQSEQRGRQPATTSRRARGDRGLSADQPQSGRQHVVPARREPAVGEGRAGGPGRLDAAEIALNRNSTEGLSTVIFGVPMQPTGTWGPTTPRCRQGSPRPSRCTATSARRRCTLACAS